MPDPAVKASRVVADEDDLRFDRHRYGLTPESRRPA